MLGKFLIENWIWLLAIFAALSLLGNIISAVRTDQAMDDLKAIRTLLEHQNELLKDQTRLLAATANALDPVEGSGGK